MIITIHHKKKSQKHLKMGPTTLFFIFASIVCTVVYSLPERACAPPHDKYPFCDVTLPRSERVNDLIQRLTLDEKPYLLVARESPKGNISRLGLPAFDWGGNCIHGVQSRCTENGVCATSYPNPNALGSTYNRSVWKGMGNTIGVELRAFYLLGVGEDHDSNLPAIGLDCWSPNINIVRDPRWGYEKKKCVSYLPAHYSITNHHHHHHLQQQQTKSGDSR